MGTKNKGPNKKTPGDKQINTPLKTKAAKQRLIYCGPNVPGIGLQQFMVFKGGYPEHLKKHLQACPAIQELCVPVSDFAKGKKGVIVPGTAANQYYQEILRYSAELKEGK